MRLRHRRARPSGLSDRGRRVSRRLAPRGSYNRPMAEGSPEPTYSLYRRGMELLEDGDFEDAAEPLAEAARREPEKSSVREALGRAYYRAGRFRLAAVEFGAVVESHPVNDYAHFCLGRALSMTGDTRGARHHLALASNLRPERRDYRYYRRLLDA